MIHLRYCADGREMFAEGHEESLAEDDTPPTGRPEPQVSGSSAMGTLLAGIWAVLVPRLSNAASPRARNA